MFQIAVSLSCELDDETVKLFLSRYILMHFVQMNSFHYDNSKTALSWWAITYVRLFSLDASNKL